MKKFLFILFIIITLSGLLFPMKNISATVTAAEAQAAAADALKIYAANPNKTTGAYVEATKAAVAANDASIIATKNAIEAENIYNASQKTDADLATLVEAQNNATNAFMDASEAGTLVSQAKYAAVTPAPASAASPAPAITGNAVADATNASEYAYNAKIKATEALNVTIQAYYDALGVFQDADKSAKDNPTDADLEAAAKKASDDVFAAQENWISASNTSLDANLAFATANVALVKARTAAGMPVSAVTPAPKPTDENPCKTFTSTAGCYQQLAPIMDPSTNKAIDTTSFPTYLQAIYRIGIGLCFVLGVIMFTWAGIEYIVSEAMNSKADAKKRMSSALIGLAIVLVSYILLNTINPDLLKLQDINLQTPAKTTAPAAPKTP